MYMLVLYLYLNASFISVKHYIGHEIQILRNAIVKLEWRGRN